MEDIIQLRVFIQGIRPVIWRRLRVEKNTSLFELHHIIQIAFGWQNYHLFEFEYHGYNFGEINDVVPEANENMLDARTITLESLLVDTRELLRYTYDFGDNWMHYIVVERFLAKANGLAYPYCMSGKNACPPEDCGGIKGYDTLIKALKNKQHPEHKEYKNWVGKGFSPDGFELNKINNQLLKLDDYIQDWLNG